MIGQLLITTDSMNIIENKGNLAVMNSEVHD